MPRKLTFEEFAWRCLWLELGVLAQTAPSYYVRQQTRILMRRAKHNNLWPGVFGDQSQYAYSVRTKYMAWIVDEQMLPREVSQPSGHSAIKTPRR